MNVRELARRGAPVRIQELREEINVREAEISLLENSYVKSNGGVRTMGRKAVAWQSTPEGRMKLSRAQRKRYRRVREEAAATAAKS